MHTHKNKPEWEDKGLNKQPFKSLQASSSSFFLLNNIIIQPLWVQTCYLLAGAVVKVCGTQRGAHDGGSCAFPAVEPWLQGGSVNASERQSEALEWQANLQRSYQSPPLRCQRKWGAPAAKKKWWLTKLPKNSPPSPVLPYGKWNAASPPSPHPPPHTLGHTKTPAPFVLSDIYLLDRLQGQAPGLFFVGEMFHSSLMVSNWMNCFNWNRQQLKVL